ncbi:hypothetical protein ONK29_25290, partial [Salmonella enterica subsp. enterica serovar Anatum]|nr:hypothetical protein [Salmonella enterica subsp. enterica serovar Anatum]
MQRYPAANCRVEKVMEYCKDNGLDVNYSQTNVASLPNNTDGAALVVSTTKVPY